MSNGQAERAVKSIKDILKKEGRTVTKAHLAEVCFSVNCHQEEGSGSRAERFFRRSPRSLLPNSIKRELKHRDLIKHRHEKQLRLAKAKGRESKDEFKMGDLVRVQDHVDKNWKKKGKVVGVRDAGDGTNQSFIVRMENGHEAIRHKNHMRHAAGIDEPTKKVKFDEGVEQQLSERKEKAQVDRPRTRSWSANKSEGEVSVNQSSDRNHGQFSGP